MFCESWRVIVRPNFIAKFCGLAVWVWQKQLTHLVNSDGPSLRFSKCRLCCSGSIEPFTVPIFLVLKFYFIINLNKFFFLFIGLDSNAPVIEPSPEIAAAFERLLCYPGLLETTDAKCQCNVVEGLLNEVRTRTSLLSEWHVTSILSKRWIFILLFISNL